MNSTTKPVLLRILGVAFGIAAVVGATIGGGILRVPGTVATLVPDPALLLALWALAGIYVIVAASCFAELATALPAAGGPLVYVDRSMGRYAGFAVGWCDWLLNVVGAAALAVAVGDFAGALLPAWQGHANRVAFGALLGLGILNWLGLRIGAGAQQLFSAAKILGFAALILVFLFYPGEPAHVTGAATTAAPPASMTALVPVTAAGIVIALQMIKETYAGWETPCYLVEEHRAPGAAIPRAIFGGVALVLAIYLLANVALLHVLGLQGLAGSTLAFAAAAQKVFGGSADRIVTTLAIVSVLGTLNVGILYIPRILFSLGRSGYLSPRLAEVSASGTPRPALLVTILVALPFAAGFNFEILYGTISFMGLLVHTLTFAALFILRRREPDLPRPFRAWGYPLLPGLVLLVSVALSVGIAIANPLTALGGAVLVAVSYPLYRFTGRH